MRKALATLLLHPLYILYVYIVYRVNPFFIFTSVADGASLSLLQMNVNKVRAVALLTSGVFRALLGDMRASGGIRTAMTASEAIAVV